MKSSFLVCTALGLMTVCAAAGAGVIQPDKKPAATPPPAQPSKPTAPPATAPANPTPPPAKPATGQPGDLKQWMGQEPGPEHKVLEFMIGEWDATVKLTPTPGAPAITATGTEKNEWVLNNRFVESHYSSVMNNTPFNGISYMGFNDATKKYESTWMDSSATGIMLMTGDFDTKTHTMTFTGDGEDASGSKKHYRSVTKIESNDKFVFSMMEVGPDSKEFTVLQITYTRKGGAHKMEPKPDTKAPPAKPAK
jgi:hypothetical protein